jgi:hypothetical protein
VGLGLACSSRDKPDSFLAEAAEAAGIAAYFPILVHCDDETRVKRLSLDRQQAELVNESMMSWANYLRRDAKKRGCDILDTSAIVLDQSVAYVIAQLRKMS